MNWLRLIRLESQPFFGKKLDSRIADLNAEIERIERERAAIETAMRETAGGDVATVDVAEFFGSQFRHRAIAVLQEEIRVRRLWEGVYDETHKAYCKQADKQFEKLEALKADVRARLVNIGYIDCDIYANVRGKITPGYINDHPEVCEAAGLLSTYQATARDNARKMENTNQLREVETKLKSLHASAATAGI